jgi:N-methylhydantoinase A
MNDLTFAVGGDVGGTFTAVSVTASDGRVATARVPSGDAPGAALVTAIERTADTFELTPAVLFGAVRRVALAIDLVRPALDQGALARTALVTTAGFGDTLELGRAQRAGAGAAVGEPAGPARQRPALVPRSLVVEVPERVTRSGAVLAPLDEDGATQAIKGLAEAEVEAVAVCTLWATANPEHERRLRELVADILPDAAVALSHEVAPVVGEHARMSATAATAALAPAAAAAADRIAAALAEAGVTAPILLATGLGGVGPASMVTARPLDTATARPAAGLVAVAEAAERIAPRDGPKGAGDLLVLDAGGSSVHIGLLLDPGPVDRPEPGQGAHESQAPSAEAGGSGDESPSGDGVDGAGPVERPEAAEEAGPALVPLRERHQLAGLELAGPVLDARTVAGGGASVAGVRAGTLEVGLRPTGAEPRPACFTRGRGGPEQEPTVTDADLLLGTLDPRRLERAGLRVDRGAAERAMIRRVAAPLGLNATAAAWAVREVFAARVAEAATLVAADHGREPAELTLVVAGGLGPAHGWLLCRALGLDEFVVPAGAAALPAVGAAAAGRRAAVEQSLHLHLAPDVGPEAEDVAAVRAVVSGAAARAAAAVRAAGPGEPQHGGGTQRLRQAIRQAIIGAPGVGLVVERSLRMRYRGQSRQLTVPLAGLTLDDEGLEAVRDRFEQAYADRFGPAAARSGAGIEILGALAVATGPSAAQPATTPTPTGAPATGPTPRPGAGGPSYQEFERTGRRPVVFDDPERPVDTAVWAAERPVGGQLLSGPCLIELPGCAVVVPPGAEAATDDAGNLRVRLVAAAERVARLASVDHDEGGDEGGDAGGDR